MKLCFFLTLLLLLVLSVSARASYVSRTNRTINYRFGDEVSVRHRKLIRNAVTTATKLLAAQTGIVVEKLVVQVSADLDSISRAYAHWFKISPAEARAMWLAGSSVVSGPKAIFYYTGNQWLAGVLVGADREALLKVSGHEYFHVLQWQLTNGNLIGRPDTETPLGGPRWLIEGASMVAGAIASDAVQFKKYDLSKQEYRQRAAPTNASLTSMENWPGLAAVGKAGYPLSFMACDFLLQVSSPHTSALRLFIKFWKAIGEGENWEAAFSGVFGQEAYAFYQRFAAYQSNQFLLLTPSINQGIRQEDER